MMLGLIALLAAQAAPAAPAGQAAAEAQARKVLAQRGMSPAGIEASFGAQRRHQPALAAIVKRGAAAENAVRAALTKRPVDVDGFVRAMTARTEAAAALQREVGQVAIDQMRALSPADRIVAAQMPAAAPAVGAPKR